MLEITPLPAFSDNYIWIGIHRKNNSAWVVDPGDATPVVQFLKEQNLVLETILITHKHNDHTGGIAELRHHYPKIKIYGNPLENISEINFPVTEGNSISINHHYIFKTFHIPGHTLGHVAYHCAPILFCGDTLFSGGCGRVFEGTMEQMYSSLRRLSELPDDTFVYCGHEYTLANLLFAHHVEPSNTSIIDRIENVKKLRSENKPSLPSTIAIEKLTNPFLRCDQPEIRKQVEQHTQKKINSSLEVFQYLREWKNTFKI